MDIIFKHWNYLLNDDSEDIESIQDCLKRASLFLKQVKETYKNKKILIVSHGSFIKALHYNIVGYDKTTDFLIFRPENGSVYEYEME